MKRYLISCVPLTAAWLALVFIVYSYTGEWADWWTVLGAACAGVAIGSWRLV